MLTIERINPQMIAIARESRGLVQADIAEQLGIVKSTAWKFEQESPSISSHQQEKLAQILKYPTSFFYQKGEALPLLLSYRKRNVVASKLIAQVEANINIYRLNIEQLFTATNKEDIKLPVLDVTKYVSPQECAKQLRKLWKIERGVIENLSEVIEQKQIPLICFDFDTERIDGRGTTALDKFPIIVTNKSMLGDRQRFTLAYELGHLVMHLHTSPAYDRDLSHEANLFAAEFLMPERDITNDLQNLTASKDAIPMLGELKRKWKVSMQSLVYRANDLQLITDRTKRSLLQEFNDRNIRRREPKELDIPVEQYKLVRDLLTQYKTKQKLNVSKLAAFLHLEHDDFLQRYNY